MLNILHYPYSYGNQMHASQKGLEKAVYLLFRLGLRLCYGIIM